MLARAQPSTPKSASIITKKIPGVDVEAFLHSPRESLSIDAAAAEEDDCDHPSCKGCQALLTENQLLRELLLRTSTDAQQIINAFEKQSDFQRLRFETVLKPKGPARNASLSSPSKQTKAPGQLSLPMTPDIFRKLSTPAAQELVKVHPEFKELYDVATTCKGSLFERIVNSDMFSDDQKKKQIQLSTMRQLELNTLDIQAKSPRASKRESQSSGQKSPQRLPISPEAAGDDYFKLSNDFVASLRQ
ncbi:hypothetical protein SDRG_11274 [Saprolegnia diclina VS20]|uniref:Uncharacterized protein n=1 Tax=Saprolegnia diclina (strain VS20) TaxID=1156394 RepID=T0PZT6_SAPDV|nr:hypothetical protein SDRG_11274 [Saprolegnia diclina VS20]EQC31089.1 hypothetical protein SDRG_11274 [Saprolegnia diclina VS20]|eukprot:XP_008615528.1 hypothetical protein SDRG_11274 [Saprolegnia diclina VS20]